MPSNSEVIGSDVSPSVFGLIDLVVWHFNVLNPDWENKFDVLYSNSHDHIFSLKNTFQVWLNSLNKTGIIILEHSIAHEWFKRSEPSALKFESVPFLPLEWFESEVFVCKIFYAPEFRISSDRHKIFVISRNSQFLFSYSNSL